MTFINRLKLIEFIHITRLTIDLSITVGRIYHNCITYIKQNSYGDGLDLLLLILNEFSTDYLYI